MPRILVCDDERERATRLREELQSVLPPSSLFAVDGLSPSDFADAIATLEHRQRVARDSPAEYPHGHIEAEMTSQNDSKHPFDDADAVFLDYDLVRLGDESPGAGSSESGERVAYLARCYSRCGTIVAYNQFAYANTFDLTLRGHLRSFADLNISSDSLSNKGLWSDDYDGFRPWYWPLLLDAHVKFRRRIQQFLSNPQVPILELIGLGSGPVRELLTRELLEFLSPEKDPEAATLEDFVRDSRQGLRPKDRLWEPQAAGRIGAARLSKWLERAVLPGQNILVDAPHLIDRFPSLLTGSSNNDVCRLGTSLPDLGLDYMKLSSAAFSGSDWLSRPAWIWPKVARDESIPEVQDPWAPTDNPPVFCEDASRFCDHESAHEFVADVKSEFSKRYVHKFDGVRYEPAVRFLM